MKWIAPTLILVMCMTTFADDPGKRVKGVMALDEATLLRLVPSQCPDVAAPCPKCRSHMRAMKAKWLWNVNEPNKLTCSRCGAVVPGNAYPMNKTGSYLNIRGEHVTIPYYQGPKPKGDLRGNPHPERYCFAGALDEAHYQYTANAARDLAGAYEQTGNNAYARKALLILNEYARKYSHYLCHRGRGVNNYYVDVKRGCLKDGRLVNTGRDAPYDWTDSRMRKWWAAELDRNLWQAYRRTRNSNGAAALSKELGENVQQNIDAMFREMVDFIMLIPWQKHMSNNLTNFFANFADVGRLIGEPGFCHIPYRYCTSVLLSYEKGHRGVGYAYDLHNAEGTQGHYGVMARIYEVFRAIDGYSDPPGYIDKVDGLHLDHVNLAHDMPEFTRGIYTPEAYAVPSGRSNPLHDSMPYVQGGRGSAGPELQPLKASRCRLLPGFAHAVLGVGAGDQQSQVQLHFSSDKANHCHHDCLGLTWFAHGAELSGEIGYQRNILREWAASTLTHNTIVIDRAEQPGSTAIGSLTLFANELPGFTAVQVDGAAAYGVKRCRRTVLHVTTDPATPYFVDIVEVDGGSLHDYTLHGSLEGDQIGETSLQTTPLATLLNDGETWNAPQGTGNLYGLFRNIHAVKPNGPFHVTFKYKDQPGCGTRIHVPNLDGCVYLAESPALRKAGHYNDKAVYNWWMPHLILRRRAARSLFVTVVDMFSGGPKITHVQRLDAAPGKVGLSIRINGRTDTISVSPNEQKAELVSTRGGTSDTYTIGSSKFTGRIDATRPRAFATSTELPLGNELRGSWMVVKHGGTMLTNAYEIDHVERDDGMTWIHLTYEHGLAVEGDTATERYSGWRTFKGGETFTITRSSATVRVPTIEPNTGPWDALEMQRFVPFMDRQVVTLTGESIRYTTDGSDPLTNGKPYTAPFALTSSAVVKCVIPGGIEKPRGIKQRFVKALEPIAIAAPKPGLIFREAAKKGKTPAPRVVEQLAIVGLLNLLSQDKSEQRFAGYIRIPRDGVYTFYAKGGRGFILTVGRLEMMDTRFLGPCKEWRVHVPLKAGMHKLTFSFFGAVDSALSTAISGPGLPRSAIPPGSLFHE